MIFTINFKHAYNLSHKKKKRFITIIKFTFTLISFFSLLPSEFMGFLYIKLNTNRNYYLNTIVYLYFISITNQFMTH